jgi:hypothetical protein
MAAGAEWAPAGVCVCKMISEGIVSRVPACSKGLYMCGNGDD